MSQCEQCNTSLEEPDYVETVPGFREWIELWFCKDCNTA